LASNFVLISNSSTNSNSSNINNNYASSNNNTNSNTKESEKIGKYQDLALELTRLWKTSTKVIPIVIGALGASNKTVDWMALLGVAEANTH